MLFIQEWDANDLRAIDRGRMFDLFIVMECKCGDNDCIGSVEQRHEGMSVFEITHWVCDLPRVQYLSSTLELCVTEGGDILHHTRDTYELSCKALASWCHAMLSRMMREHEQGNLEVV